MSNADPFQERTGPLRRQVYRVLDCAVQFESDSAALLRLARHAFAGMPPAPAARGATNFTVRLRLARGGNAQRGRQPPAPRMFSGADLLGSFISADNFALVMPAERRACVSISKEMLRFEYHARYELLEFAVLTLLARARRLVPLHAACFGRSGRGLLLIGNSGAGKSTACLHALLDGMDFLAEDSVFVAPDSLLATGIPSFLHLQRDSLRFARGHPLANPLRASPRIRRRSGVEKFEIDLRRPGVELAARPLEIVALIALSSLAAGGGAALRRKTPPQVRALLESTQPYAAGQPGWRNFCARVGKLPAFELRRSQSPREATRLLRALLDSRQSDR